MKKTLVGLLALVLIIGGAFLYLRRGHVYEISQTEIQSRVESQFPVEKCVLVFCIQLDRPSVQLQADATRVMFGSNALLEVAFSNEQYDGSVGFSGALAYEPAQGGFFLDDSRLERLDMSGISEQYKDNVDKLASLLVAEYLRANPIYTFKDTLFESVAPWLELKEVDMAGGVLRVRIGLAQ